MFSIKSQIVFLISFITSLNVMAGMWCPMEPCEYKSSNGKYKAKVIPVKFDFLSPKSDSKPTLLFFEKQEDDNWKELWKIDLANEFGPTHAMVADDGVHVVTYGNWGAGLAESSYKNWVVFYNKKGLLKSYTRQEVHDFEKHKADYWKTEKKLEPLRKELEKIPVKDQAGSKVQKEIDLLYGKVCKCAKAFSWNTSVQPWLLDHTARIDKKKFYLWLKAPAESFVFYLETGEKVLSSSE